MKRGEVWWVVLPGPAGRRPAILLSRDAAYRVRAAITVAPITRTLRKFPLKLSWIEMTVAGSLLVNLDASPHCRKFDQAANHGSLAGKIRQVDEQSDLLGLGLIGGTFVFPSIESVNARECCRLKRTNEVRPCPAARR